MDLYLTLMKHFNKLGKLLAWANNQRVVFAIFVLLISLPNFVLFFTEPLPLLTKVCNIVLPFSIFWYLFTLAKKPGKMFWILFLFIFFDAFQIVLLYLFGNSVIAVDMFLNVVTSNSGEIEELLGNLIPALVIVFGLYGSGIALAIKSCLNKRTLDKEFLHRQRRYSYFGMGAGAVLLLLSFAFTKGFAFDCDIYPVNVSYNLYLAVDREISNKHYFETSKNFKFGASSVHDKNEKEIYVLVIGETARADNFGIYGYGRNTTPNLSTEPNLVAYRDALSESNTTHKSVPMIMSAISAECFGKIYEQKGIVTAYKEAGYYTIFISNQRPNHSFIDFFGEEADYSEFVKEKLPLEANVYDKEMLPRLSAQLKNCKAQKVFVVLHMYGSHFNYKERYPEGDAYFKPDTAMAAHFKNREMLVNAYDNTIRYTDSFLKELITMLQGLDEPAAVVYTSDHGEDIFDDDRKLFLHASPVPSCYQIHVPLMFWASDSYIEKNQKQWQNIVANKDKAVSTNKVIFHTLLDISGVNTAYKVDSISLANSKFKESKRWYLNDHNDAKSLDEVGMGSYDKAMFDSNGIKYP